MPLSERLRILLLAKGLPPGPGQASRDSSSLITKLENGRSRPSPELRTRARHSRAYINSIRVKFSGDCLEIHAASAEGQLLRIFNPSYQSPDAD